MELALKYGINEKSAIFAQKQWNFAKMTQPWGSQINKVSIELDENCEFFINGQFLSQFHFSIEQSLSTIIEILACIEDYVFVFCRIV